MIPAAAALAGALIGGLVTIGVTALQINASEDQSRTDYLRKERRDIYVQMIDLDTALDEAELEVYTSVDLADERSDLDALYKRLVAMAAQAREMARTDAQVQLLGDANLLGVSRDLVREHSFLINDLRTYVSGQYYVLDNPDSKNKVASSDVEDSLAQLIQTRDEFVGKARANLGAVSPDELRVDYD